MLRPLQVEVDGKGYPHWVLRPEEEWELYESFQTFLYAVWRHLGLPKPTLAQLEIAHRLQYGADSTEWALLSPEGQEARYSSVREDIIRAFRGLGKSYVTSAFAIWLVMRNPRDEKVLVVSATGGKAKQFVDQTKGILESMPLVQWLLTGDRANGSRRRDMADKFDVTGASLSQSFSVAAAGIDGQITGNRATTLIADDIEIPRNSKSVEARQKILNTVRTDFVPITKTEWGKGDIRFLGTPQTEESVYNVLVSEMGFSCFCIPVRYPLAEKLKNYRIERLGLSPLDILAPYLKALHDNGELPHGAPTDTRFGAEEMLKIESKGRSTFALQYMLDTELSDAERYPLKQHDLIVFEVNPIKAPITMQWGHFSDKRNIVKDIPNLGFSGDHLLAPLFYDEDWRAYEGSVLFVDPAGRGKDETAWAVVKALNGMLYLAHVGAEVTDPAKAMQMIAIDAKRFNVNVVEVEPNFGQGMWVTAFGPVLAKVWAGGCTVVESEWAVGQKEARIIDTLEPVMTQHRLVVSESLLRADAKQEEKEYSLLYQLTHITRERRCLTHDDRLDAVAGAVAHFTRNMAQDVDLAAKAQQEAEMDEEIEEFMEMFSRDRPRGSLRGRKRNGQRTEVWQSTIVHGRDVESERYCSIRAQSVTAAWR